MPHTKSAPGSTQEPAPSPTPTPSLPPTFAGNGNLAIGYNPDGVRHTDSTVPTAPRSPVRHDYAATGPAPGRLGFRWINGSIVAATNTDPRVQVVQYNEDTFVLRQNVCVHWEAPFVYLLFGNEGALLIDSGATANPQHFPLRETVDAIVARWCQMRGRPSTPLTIALTSGEDIAQNQGLKQFIGRPRTTIVPPPIAAMKAHYGFAGAWPGATGMIDLGDRIIEVIPTPGTHCDGVSFYDPYCDLLFTGDLLFPGRINIGNDRDYVASLIRLRDFAARNPILFVLGGHIDMMFAPGRFYPRFATNKPYERILQLLPEVIDDALRHAREVQGRDMMLIRPDFVLFNGVSPDQRTSVWPEGVPQITLPYPF